jgi:hypothetical protein
VGKTAMEIYIIRATEAPIIFTNENWGNENDLPQTIIAKSIIINKNKSTHEETIISSKES